jgi:hypothetical protein
VAVGLEGIVRRIEWLEKQIAAVLRAIAELRDAVAAALLKIGEARDQAGQFRMVILRPDATVLAATFAEAVPYDAGPPEVDYVPPRLVPETGTGRIWQTFDPATGELRAAEYVSRYVPESDPPEYSLEDATVEFDNINPTESIPGTAKYVICMMQGGRLIAVTWDCG